MDRVLNRFIVSLRGAGVPVSVSESIDAAQALAICGYADNPISTQVLAYGENSSHKLLPEKSAE